MSVASSQFRLVRAGFSLHPGVSLPGREIASDALVGRGRPNQVLTYTFIYSLLQHNFRHLECASHITPTRTIREDIAMAYAAQARAPSARRHVVYRGAEHRPCLDESSTAPFEHEDARRGSTLMRPRYVEEQVRWARGYLAARGFLMTRAMCAPPTFALLLHRMVEHGDPLGTIHDMDVFLFGDRG